MPDQDLHIWLRNLFDGVLRGAPKYLLRDLPNPSRVYAAALWVDPELESRDLMLELPPEAFLELCLEFIYHHTTGALPDDNWWHWKTENNSIWIEHTPGTVRKRRTLANVIGTNQK